MANYRNTNRKWRGFARSDHFAVRWTGSLKIRRTGNYRFGIISDDGSKLWINNRYTINNDGLHGWRNREAMKRLRPGSYRVKMEMFERGGHAGMLFRYRGPDTGNRWRVARSTGTGRRSRARRSSGGSGFLEQVFYFGQGSRCQNLNGRRPNSARRVKDSVLYSKRERLRERGRERKRKMAGRI